MPGPNGRDTMAIMALAVVSTGWIITVLAAVFVPGFSPPAMVNLAMLAILGGLFGSAVIEKGRRVAAGEDKEADLKNKPDNPRNPPPPGPPVAAKPPGPIAPVVRPGDPLAQLYLENDESE